MSQIGICCVSSRGIKIDTGKFNNLWIIIEKRDRQIGDRDVMSSKGVSYFNWTVWENKKKKLVGRLSTVTHALNPSTPQHRQKEHEFKASLSCIRETFSKNKNKRVWMICLKEWGEVNWMRNEEQIVKWESGVRIQREEGRKLSDDRNHTAVSWHICCCREIWKLTDVSFVFSLKSQNDILFLWDVRMYVWKSSE